MTDGLREGLTITGGDSAPEGKEPTLGARFLAALFDLFLMPIILSVVFGLLFFAAPDTLRLIVLVVVSIAWTCLRDVKGGQGPGKRMAKIKVIDTATGQVPTVWQLILRNVLLWVPYVLLFGYPIEMFIIFILKKDRLGDRMAKCKVIVAG